MNFFDRAANHISRLMGHPAAFALACLAILLWGALGPIEGYSDTWQLIVNTSTTIVTFLMVFLIQNTQNRDNQALHLKIDELLRALDAADTRLVDLEERSEKELGRLHEHYKLLAHDSRSNGEAGNQSETTASDDGRDPASPRNQSSRRDVQQPQS